MPTERRSNDLLRGITIVLAVLVLLPVLVMVLMMATVPMMGMMGRGGGMMNAVPPVWSIGMVLVWFVVLLGVGYLLYRFVRGVGTATTADPALEELRLAYARGDLSEEEFETRREKLSRDEQSN